jgi:hypothetical protein
MGTVWPPAPVQPADVVVANLKRCVARQTGRNSSVGLEVLMTFEVAINNGEE